MTKPTPPCADERSRITPQGAMLGARASDRVLVWYGVSYAAPPVGDLRWRTPQPPAPWDGVRDATQRPPPARQTLTFSTPIAGSGEEGAVIGDEDCLYLTIWSPAWPEAVAAPPERLAVIVWLHGGGNLVGDGSDYDCANLVAAQNVIVVAINHRLNLLGWFAHEALHDVDGPAAERSGNFAILDQIQALRWIKANIAIFDGDPSCVTICGHSGGGWNVRALLCAPLAKGLFHRAIIQSVGAFQTMTPQHAQNFVDDPHPGHPLSSSELLLSLWLADGRAPDAATARTQIGNTPDAEIAAYLRGQSYAALLQALAITRKRNAAIGSVEAVTTLAARRPPQMFADGVVVTDRIQAHVPIMIGTTRYEDRAFLSSNPRYVTSLYGHPVIRDRVRYAIVAEYFGKLYKANGVDQPAAQWHGDGHRIYAYRCDWDELVSSPELDFRALIGACHGSELPLLFGTTDLGREYAFQRHLYDDHIDSSFHRMSETVMAYWAAFARDGSPGTGGSGALPDWREWGDGEYLILDAPVDGGVRMSAETLTEARVVEQIRRDPRLSSVQARRKIIADLRAYGTTRLSKASYEALEL